MTTPSERAKECVPLWTEHARHSRPVLGCHLCPPTMTEARKPHCCPVCHGAGTVSRPPWVAGDQPTWDAGGIEFYECRACKGSGMVWEETP